MGIDVREVDGRREVLYSPSHQKLLDTSLERKPWRQNVGELQVSSIFRRRKARGGDGDGNPFIYALKGLYGYSISKKELWAFRPNFLTILRAFMDEDVYDYIAPVPSTKPVAFYLAKKARSFQIEARLQPDIFRKRVVGEVLPEVESKLSSGEIPAKLQREAKQLLHGLRVSRSAEFSMKHVDQKLRGYTAPLTFNASVSVEGTRVLLVDDLLSSGATMKSAAMLLRKAGVAHVSALCLLSRV